MTSEPVVAWSEARPGVGMVRLGGRTLVVMEQETAAAWLAWLAEQGDQ